jgi:hypothetical protein
VRIKHLNKSAMCKIVQNRSAIPQSIKEEMTAAVTAQVRSHLRRDLFGTALVSQRN